MLKRADQGYLLIMLATTAMRGLLHTAPRKKKTPTTVGSRTAEKTTFSTQSVRVRTSASSGQHATAVSSSCRGTQTCSRSNTYVSHTFPSRSVVYLCMSVDETYVVRHLAIVVFFFSAGGSGGPWPGAEVCWRRNDNDYYGPGPGPHLQVRRLVPFLGHRATATATASDARFSGANDLG